MLRCLAIVTSAAVLNGCASSTPAVMGYVGDDAVHLIAGEQRPTSVVGGATTTTRILEVNGVLTGANRFNAGSTTVSPGLKRLGVRLWGHAPGFGLQGSEAFACVEFRAKPGRAYVVSGSVTATEYRLYVHDRDDGTVVLEVPVRFGQTIPDNGCVAKQTT